MRANSFVSSQGTQKMQVIAAYLIVAQFKYILYFYQNQLISEVFVYLASFLAKAKDYGFILCKRIAIQCRRNLWRFKLVLLFSRQPVLYLLMLLSQAKIKEQELKYLQVSGFSLAEYVDSNDSSKIFKDLPTSTSKRQLQRLQVIKIQSSGLSSNANIKAIANILLKSIYDNQTKEDLLDFVKSSFYSSSIDFTEVKHHPLDLSNSQMKKLVVQFFYSLSYSQFRDKVDSKLAKYPIIMEILVLYIRIILKQLGLKKAENYLFRLPTQEVFTLIIDYFDLNCREQGNLYLFFEDRLFILEDDHKQILLGRYIENQNQLRPHQQENRFQGIKDLDQDEYFEDEDDNIQNQWSKQGTEGFNRSLELRGMVSQSIVFQQEAATPFFIFDQESCTSFQSSREPSLVGDQEPNKIYQKQKDVSLLKQMDRMTGSQQMGLGGNLSMKRTLLEKQFRNNNIAEEEGAFRYGYGFGTTLESPITLDSPHTLQIPSDRGFGQQVQDLQKVKEMKKSKSQKRSKTLPAEIKDGDNLKSGAASLYNKNIENSSNISQNNILQGQKEVCDCSVAKKQKLKISSRLYEINMTINPINPYFPNFTKKNNQIYQIPSTTSIFNKNNLVFTRGKSISGIQKIIKEKLNQEALKFQQSCRTMAKISKDQCSSAYSVRGVVNPESDACSRRQFSPLSNMDRPLSPFGGSKSITSASSPKITFKYINPLKYSTCMKKGFEKTQQKR